MARNFPAATDLTSADLMTVAEVLEGQITPQAAAPTLWWIAGVAAGQVLANPTAVAAHTFASNADAAKHLRANAASPSKINLGGILKVLWPIIQTLIPVILGSIGTAAGS